MKKKWHAKINAFDEEKKKIIKIGIIQKDKNFYVVTDENENIEEYHFYSENQQEALDSIDTMWGLWDTFEWI